VFKTLPPPSPEKQAEELLRQADRYEADASRLLARAADLRAVVKKLRGDTE
jgi:hypothetical protein